MAKVNQKQVQLESFLREKIREAIVEQMISLNEWDPEEWDEKPEHFLPQHGEVDRHPDGDRVWNELKQEWMDAEEWDHEFGPGSIHQQELDASGQPVSELSPEDPDPALDMSPEDREGMIDSMLSMEFEENKKIQIEHLNKMIKESVKKYFASQKETLDPQLTGKMDPETALALLAKNRERHASYNIPSEIPDPKEEARWRAARNAYIKQRDDLIKKGTSSYALPIWDSKNPKTGEK